MFFAFFSEQSYPEDQWAAIWDIETSIHALLMEPEDLNKLAQLPSSDLSIHLEECLRRDGFLGRIVSDSTSLEWVDSILKNEGDVLFNFIQRVREMPAADVAKSLQPSYERIADCAKRSKIFREHLRQRAQAAKNNLRRGGVNITDEE